MYQRSTVFVLCLTLNSMNILYYNYAKIHKNKGNSDFRRTTSNTSKNEIFKH